MKNLKKLISVIIAVIMLVSSFATVSAADYADVESTDSYYKAIKVLSGLGIAQGDDEGNFNPENEVKRSEMVAFVCRMMGESDIATASSTNAFSDVAANHWAAGYIAWGVNRGIINGMGDGTFAPDASVTYQDAVVMIMRALGYDRIAQRAENGGYPTGYLKLASQYGVLKDAGYDNAKAATREIIAQLIYNALTAPLVDVSYYGVSVDDDRYVIYNGKNGNDLRTILTYANDIIKVKAAITKTPKANPTTCIDKAGNYMVEIDLLDAYDYPLTGNNGNNITSEIGADPAIVYVGETEAANLLGSTVEAYLAEDEDLGDWKLLAVIGDAKSVVEETITENINTMVLSADKKVISYYANLDDRKMTEIDIATGTDLTVYYNGVALTATQMNSFAKGSDLSATAYDDTVGLAVLLAEAADEVTFMGAKNSSYNKIFITDYTYKVVKSVNADEKLIKFDPAGAVDLDAESRGDEDFIYGIYDAAGKAMDIADIEAGDVLNMVIPLDGTSIGQYDVVDYLDIYVTNETVEGKVDEYKTTTGKYVIDGESYAPTGSVSLTIGEEGIFYLTIDGKIVKKDASSVITKNFAFYMGSDVKSSFGVNAYTLRLFTADGEIDAPVADTLKVIDGAGNATVKKSKNAGEQEAYFGNGTADEGNVTGTFTGYLAASTSEADAQAKAKARFFTYRTNANGEIIEIRLAGNAGDPIAAATKLSAKYDPDFEEFAGEKIGDAKLFIAPVVNNSGSYNVDEDKLAIGNFASLDDDTTYKTYTYMLDNEDELASVLMLQRPSYGLETSPLAVVAAIGQSLDADDNTVVSYTIVQSGETKVVKADYDEFPAPTGISDLAVGDIFQYAVDAEDEIAEAQIIYDASARALTQYAKDKSVAANDYSFVYGVVVEYADYLLLAKKYDTTPDTFVPSAVDGDTNKIKVVEVEGATYAWVEEASVNNPVKKITINGVRETVRANAVYAAVAFVNENEKAEDIVVIAMNPATMNSVAAINAVAWEIAQ